ncbi:MAG: alginate O-acetyltransferase AlgX-related protein [Planctomycetaceae bacterium]
MPDRAAEFRAACARLAANGTTLVVPGSEGWLFLRSELRHIGVGPFWGAAAARASRATTPDKADPLPAIVDFHKQLAARDLELLLVPVPCKALLHSDRLGTPPESGRLDGVHQEFYRQLAAAGVPVLDLTPSFTEELAAGRLPFCQTDSHWSPAACEVAAKKIGARIGTPAWLPARRVDLRVTTGQRTIVGDLTDRQGSEEVPVRVVSSPTVELLEDKASPLLLLGDSHTLVFHAGQELHGSGAGLADQLAWELGFPVDVMGVRGSGATAARVNVLRRSKADPKFLAGKRLVVWCFAAREFTESAGWSLVPLGPPPTRGERPGSAPR